MLVTSRIERMLVALLVASAPAVAAPILCSEAKGIAEKAICASPALMDADRKIADAFAQRLTLCVSGQRARLRQTQQFWLRDRNHCANLLSETDAAVKQCLAARMAERSAQLDRIGAACDMDVVADQYRFVDPGYLNEFAARYEGREVYVAGSARLDSCNDPRASYVAGKLEPLRGTGGSFPIRFKSMSAERREWLCATNPFSHWQGRVRRDGSRFYLYLSDLLGIPL